MADAPSSPDPALPEPPDPAPPPGPALDPGTPPAAPEPRRRAGRARVATGLGLVLGVLAGAAVLSALVVGGSLAVPSSAPSAAPPATALASPSPAAATTPAPAFTPAPVATAAPVVIPATSPTAAPSPTPASSPSPAPSPAASPADDVPAEALQARLDALRTKLAIPGASVAILWDDGRQWLGVSGLADVKRKVPVATGTAFALASISKTFTAAVILQLVEEGRLSLDQPVAPLLPAFALDKRLTVRQLLDHTSGLPDYFQNVKIDRPLQAAPDATWTAGQTWAYVRKKHPGPGQLWIYSNANYLLLGELVKHVTGRPLSAEVRERLLDPLGLTTAWYQAEERPRADGSVGYRVLPTTDGSVRFGRVAPASKVMPFRSVVTAAGGAGSMASTALDAARWIRAYAGGDVLTPETRALQVKDTAATLALGAKIPYGLGIQAVTLGGHRALGHSGRFLGFRSVARYLPDDGITIAVLTNQGVRDPSRIAAELLKIVLPPTPLPSGSPSAAPTTTP